MSKDKNTANRLVFSVTEAADKINSAIKKVADPVIATLGLDGGNVLFQNEIGKYILTRDGVTVAKSIVLRDYVEDGIATLLKEGSLRTNQEAGDGTTTTMLFSKVLVKSAQKMLSLGKSRRIVLETLDRVGELFMKALEKEKREMTTDRAFSVAMVASNHDEEIAKNVAEISETAGVDGLVFIDKAKDLKTTIEKAEGFVMPSGMMFQELYPNRGQPIARYANIPILLTDQRIYYANDAEHILRIAKSSGHESIAIFAMDFIGDAPNTFVANHVKDSVHVVLVKVPTVTVLNDLAVYLGGNIVSEKKQRNLRSVKKEDFVLSPHVFVDPHKTIVETANGGNKDLVDLIASIKKDQEKDKDNHELKQRLASLTNGIVTLFVGGNNDIEIREKVFRYEDAINAVRASLRSGYVIGGGVSVLNASNDKSFAKENDTVRILAQELGIATISQLVGDRFNDVIVGYTETKGLNLRTGKIEDLEKAGIIEPYLLSQQTIRNAVSVAKAIISIENFIVVDDTEDYDEKE